jgi:hypothetical protein
MCGVRTDPRESDAADGVRQHVAQDGRVRVARWEISVEPGVLPVCHLKQINLYVTKTWILRIRARKVTTWCRLCLQELLLNQLLMIVHVLWNAKAHDSAGRSTRFDSALSHFNRLHTFMCHFSEMIFSIILPPVTQVFWVVSFQKNSSQNNTVFSNTLSLCCSFSMRYEVSSLIPRSRFRLTKPAVVPLVKKLPAFCGTKCFIASFTRTQNILS